MKFKRIVFWTHLSLGVVAGLVILMMSVTGVLLTYERQIIGWVEDRQDVEYRGQERLPADQLVAQINRAMPSAAPLSLTFRNDAPDDPLKLQQGRGKEWLVDPYTGEIHDEGATGTKHFFEFVTNLHRFFALEGESRETGEAITGVSNIMFLLLLLTGIYIWLPRVWKWRMLRMNIFFNPRVPNSKARDYNWHHVFSFWALIPLFFVITTAIVISYDWANRLVFASFGEEPASLRPTGIPAGPPLTENASVMPLEELLQIVQNESTEWTRITMNLPAESDARVRFTVDTGTGGQPTKRDSLALSRVTGEVEERALFSSRTPGTQARVIIRFLHTGEALGIVGQTLAGLSAIAASLLVWTGLALAYRRLIQPLLRKRATANASRS